jgi:three-Cys-motif partner protein
MATVTQASGGSFFSEPTEASKVKAEIISKFFSGWATVISRTTRGRKIAYVDLFAGRGRYDDDDGTPSTPLLVLERAIRDPVVSQMLVTIFNDRDHAAALKAQIAALPGIDNLKYPPTVRSMEVAKETALLFNNIKLVPTLAFIDPWGYRGLTRELIQALLKDWGCDCVFFFNYNRINMGITNQAVSEHMKAIFGPAWLADLRAGVPLLRPALRERVIVGALKRGLKQLGGEYVLPFRFLRMDGRTSHYLVFVSKAFRGCHIMRNVMAGESSQHDVDGVASFEYDPRLAIQPALGLREGARLGKLKEKIIEEGTGKKLTVESLYEWHSRDALFTFSNYQEALRQLEVEGGRVAITRLSNRRVWRGKPTMPEGAHVTIPKP